MRNLWFVRVDGSVDNFSIKDSVANIASTTARKEACGLQATTHLGERSLIPADATRSPLPRSSPP